MARRQYEQFCLRFSMDNRQHTKLYRVMENLDPEIYKSKNQFIMNALEHYVDGCGEDNLTIKGRKKSEVEYLSKEEFLEDRQKIKDEIRIELYQELIVYLANSSMAGAMRQVAGAINPVAENTLSDVGRTEQEADSTEGISNVSEVIEDVMKWS